jgi:CRISPR/Cas system-associated exonuclease Cas4 (RecB family)
MYCNSCLKQIPKDEITYCSECGVPLHKKCANHCLDCGKELCDSCYSENKFRCSSCFDEHNPFKKIRRSYIKQYELCPYSLYLQLVEGIEPPMGRYAQLGIIVHELLEQIQLGKLKCNTAIGLLEERVMEWNKETEDEYSIIPFDLLEQGKECIHQFEIMMPYLKGDNKLEYKIEYSIGNDIPNITCTLDRISFVGDEIHIHDWKTGKPMSGKKLVEDLQPPLYLYACYKEFKKMPESFTLHYLSKGKHLVYKKIDDDTYEVKTARNKYVLKISEALERTRKILKGIKHQQFNIPKESEVLWYCNSMCWYGLSGTCQGQQDEEWHKLAKERRKAE